MNRVVDGVAVIAILQRMDGDKKDGFVYVVLRYNIDLILGKVKEKVKFVEHANLIEAMRKGMAVDNFKINNLNGGLICVSGKYSDYVVIEYKKLDRKYESDGEKLVYVIGESKQPDRVYSVVYYSFSRDVSSSIDDATYRTAIGDEPELRRLNFISNASKQWHGLEFIGEHKEFQVESGYLDADGLRSAGGTEFVHNMNNVLRMSKMTGQTLKDKDFVSLAHSLLVDRSFSLKADVLDKIPGGCRNTLKLSPGLLDKLRQIVDVKMQSQNSTEEMERDARRIAVLYASEDSLPNVVMFPDLFIGSSSKSDVLVCDGKAAIEAQRGSYIVDLATGVVEKCTKVSVRQTYGYAIDLVATEGSSIEVENDYGRLRISIQKDHDVQIINVETDKDVYIESQFVSKIVPYTYVYYSLSSDKKRIIPIKSGGVGVDGSKEAIFKYTDLGNKVQMGVSSDKEEFIKLHKFISSKKKPASYYASKKKGGLFQLSYAEMADGVAAAVRELAVASAKKEVRLVKNGIYSKKEADSVVALVFIFGINDSSCDRTYYWWMESYHEVEMNSSRRNTDYDNVGGNVYVFRNVEVCGNFNSREELKAAVDAEDFFRHNGNNMIGEASFDSGMKLKKEHERRVGICSEYGEYGRVYMNSRYSGGFSADYSSLLESKDFELSEIGNIMYENDFKYEIYPRYGNMAVLSRKLNVSFLREADNIDSGNKYCVVRAFGGAYISEVFSYGVFRPLLRLKEGSTYDMEKAVQYGNCFDLPRILQKYFKICLESIRDEVSSQIEVSSLEEYILYDSLLI